MTQASNFSCYKDIILMSHTVNVESDNWTINCVCDWIKQHVSYNARTKRRDYMSIWIYSVLTRILPWVVPGPPLLRNRGPVRTLGGQSYKKHAVRRTWARTPNCLLHEVPTWSNMAEEVFTIRRRSLRCSGTCVGPMKVKATKLKTLTHLISCFLFIQTNRML